ncbi:MAG: hypothetical protein ACYCT7_09320 [bacterium]
MKDILKIQLRQLNKIVYSLAEQNFIDAIDIIKEVKSNIIEILEENGYWSTPVYLTKEELILKYPEVKEKIEKSIVKEFKIREFYDLDLDKVIKIEFYDNNFTRNYYAKQIQNLY